MKINTILVISTLLIMSCSLFNEAYDCKIINNTDNTITIKSLSGYVLYSDEEIVLNPNEERSFFSEDTQVGESLLITFISDNIEYELETGYVQDKSYIDVTILDDLTLDY